MEEKSKLRLHKEAFRTLLCGHLSRTMDVDVLLTFLQKSKYLHVIIKININVVIIFLGTVLRGG
jgi:hypothetical protein